MKIAVALSGGVDSSVTAMLLKDMGHEVVAVTFKLGEHTNEAIEDARRVTEFLGIEHVVKDYSELFKKEVVNDFLNAYISGKTPNPCIVCNQLIKFGQFISDAKELGCEKMATGHYAKIVNKDGKNYIAKADDLKKDQSYALYRLSEEQINFTILATNKMTKDELRKLAAERGLPVANRPDSQDICFIPTGNHGEFIESNLPKLPSVGFFIDVNGNKIAKHKGIHNYTIGQRKGLGVSLGKYAYVKEIDPKTQNIILTTEEDDIFTNTVRITSLDGANTEAVYTLSGLTAKIRYAHKPAEVTSVVKDGEDTVVTFKEPQRAVTPGQSLVFYLDDIVIAGGIIR